MRQHVRTSVLESLEFDAGSNTNIMDFYYYFIILIAIEFGIKFSLELVQFSIIELLELELESNCSNSSTLVRTCWAATKMECESDFSRVSYQRLQCAGKMIRDELVGRRNYSKLEVSSPARRGIRVCSKTASRKILQRISEFA